MQNFAVENLKFLQGLENGSIDDGKSVAIKCDPSQGICEKMDYQGMDFSSLTENIYEYTEEFDVGMMGLDHEEVIVIDEEIVYHKSDLTQAASVLTQSEKQPAGAEQKKGKKDSKEVLDILINMVVPDEPDRQKKDRQEKEEKCPEGQIVNEAFKNVPDQNKARVFLKMKRAADQLKTKLLQ